MVQNLEKLLTNIIPRPPSVEMLLAAARTPLPMARGSVQRSPGVLQPTLFRLPRLRHRAVRGEQPECASQCVTLEHHDV